MCGSSWDVPVVWIFSEGKRGVLCRSCVIVIRKRRSVRVVRLRVVCVSYFWGKGEKLGGQESVGLCGMVRRWLGFDGRLFPGVGFGSMRDFGKGETGLVVV